MTTQFDRDLEDLQHELLALSGIVEQMIAQATQALLRRQAVLAAAVIDRDQEVDQREVQIEEDCLRMLALHRPVAADLRRIATAMKVNVDLERMADLAVNVAQRAQGLLNYPDFKVPAVVEQMMDIARSMTHDAIDALVRQDVEAARRVCQRDVEVDDLNRCIIGELLSRVHKSPQQAEAALHCFSASRHIERIADHATNIAEDVIYLAQGQIARHQSHALYAHE